MMDKERLVLPVFLRFVWLIKTLRVRNYKIKEPGRTWLVLILPGSIESYSLIQVIQHFVPFCIMSKI